MKVFENGDNWDNFNLQEYNFGLNDNKDKIRIITSVIGKAWS